MAVMSPEVKDLFTEVADVVLATANVEGQPNACVVGMKAIIDDETIYCSDQFFNKTFQNVLQNNQVSVAFWSGNTAYQIYGTARYVDAGEEFEAQKAWVDAAFENMGLPIKAKGGCFITVDKVFQMAPGPEAGNQIA